MAKRIKQQALALQSNILWNTIGSLVYLGLQWLTTVIVVYLAGYGAAGDLSLAMSASNFLISFSLYGMRTYQVSDQKNRYAPEIYLGSRFMTCAGAVLLGVGLVLVNGYPLRQTGCILLYLLYRLSEATVDVLHGFEQKAGRMDYIGISFLLRGVLSFGAFVGVLALGGSLNQAILAMAVLVHAVVFLYDWPHTCHLQRFQHKPQVRGSYPLLKECFPFMVYLFLINGVNSVPRFAIEAQLGEEILGYYSSVATPATLVQMAATFIFSPLIVPLTEAWNGKDKKQFGTWMFVCGGAIAAITAAALLGGKLLGAWALQLIFGESILPYAYLLQPVLLCACLTAFSWFLCTVMVIIRKKWLLVAVCAAGFLASWLSSSCFVRLMGENGASFSIILGQGLMGILLAGIMLISMKKHFDR